MFKVVTRTVVECDCHAAVFADYGFDYGNECECQEGLDPRDWHCRKCINLAWAELCALARTMTLDQGDLALF